MDTTEIEAIFSEKIAILKKYTSSVVKSTYDPLGPYSEQKERERIPPLNPIYRDTVEYRDMIRVHSDINNKPRDLMRRRAPNEDDRQFLYRYNNFENVTMPPFMKALGKLNRIFNPSNYAVQWKKDQVEEKKYFEEEIPVFGSILSYFEEIVLTQKILDPNALMVVKPYFIPTRTILNDEGKPDVVVDDTKQIVSVPTIVDCADLVDYKEAVFALVRLEEKSEVMVGGEKKREGLIFEFYDDQNIYRITQIGQKSKWQFSPPEIYFPHNLGYLPCWKLKGIPKAKELHVLYQSYFIYAVPNLNEALYHHSNLDLSLVTHMHPLKVEYVDRCPEQGCENGRISWFDEKTGSHEPRVCGTCKGTGRMTKTGPMVTKQLIIPDATQGDTDMKGFPDPGVWFVAPDPAVPEFVHRVIRELIEGAFSFINIETSNSDVKGSETALGKQIDREELFAMLLRISNEAFGLLAKVMKAMGEIRYGKDFESPLVSAPTSFSIRSEQDLLFELSEAKKAGVPDVALREILKEYFAKRFSNQANIEKIINLAFGVDRLITKDQIECSALLAAGTASKREIILHDSIFTFIENIIIEDENFWDKTYEQQAEILWNYADEKLKEIEASDPGTTDNVLKMAS